MFFGQRFCATILPAHSYPVEPSHFTVQSALLHCCTCAMFCRASAGAADVMHLSEFAEFQEDRYCNELQDMFIVDAK